METSSLCAEVSRVPRLCIARAPVQRVSRVRVQEQGLAARAARGCRRWMVKKWKFSHEEWREKWDIMVDNYG